jgi:XTP/dITP diphosphohydrolase
VTRLLVATRSRGKQAELRALFAILPFEIVFPDEIGLAQSAAEAGLEVFDSFVANARSKAAWFAAQSGLATVSDDSGLEVDALNGEPGVQSRRFAGRDGPDHQVTEANNSLLLARLGSTPDSQRSARYRCVLVMLPGRDQPEIVAEGVVEGAIVRSARGDHGFGYDPLFFSSELGLTFGEATQEAKDAVSHRARAVAALVSMLAARPA